jgi:hypothetical protein
VKKNIIRIKNRIQQINMNPHQEWVVIQSEPESISWNMKNYVFPITISITLVTFFGYILALAFYNYSATYVFIKTLAVFCESFFTLYVSSLLIPELSARFGIPVPKDKIFKLLTFSFTAFYTTLMVAGILANHKNLGSFLKFLGFYGIYPFWIGCDSLLALKPDKKNKFLVISLLVVIIVYTLINWSFGFALRAAHFAELMNA